MTQRYDALVIGAGFGGLGAALTLASAGARVALVEALTYPGGCASTFQRRGARYEAGATLFSGFDEHQLFGRWIREHQLPVTVERLDPVIELRAPGLSLPIHADREAWVASLAALPGAPSAAVRDLFALQRRVADALWGLLDSPELLPPFTLGALARLAARVPGLLPLLPLAGRPLSAVLARFGLERFTPLRIALDALCQITLQCESDRAETPFALSVLDYPFRGTGHVVGGAGALAEALLGGVRSRGGDVRLATRARALTREGGLWRLDARGETLSAPVVLANLLPQSLPTLAPDLEIPASVAALAERAEGGWGAVMLYALLPEAAPLRSGAHHVEIVVDPDRPMTEGNHLFCSVSATGEPDRAPPGLRTMTVSTHVAAAPLRALPAAEQAAKIAEIQRRMVQGLRRFAPELADPPSPPMTASPRTFERFTRRPKGLVGGVPRIAGWWNYNPRLLWPAAVAPGLYLVGDTVFPGQSTLAAAIGGQRAAVAALAGLTGRSLPAPA